jgi:hypothetical protein
VGGYLIQLAREAGAGKVIATAGTPARREHARELGADMVLDHAQPGWPQALREALGGPAVDVAFESIGGPSAQQVTGTLTPGTGQMLCYGNLSGESATVDLAALRGSGVTVTGCGGPEGPASRTKTARRPSSPLTVMPSRRGPPHDRVRRPGRHPVHRDRTGWSIRKFVRTTRRYCTIQVRAGQHLLTAEDPLPPDLRDALCV